jgi:predicted thioesterase
MQTFPGISIGLNGVATMVTDERDLAIALGSGSLPVLGTPRVIALCEEATVNAIAGALPPDLTTVGVHIDIRHLAPTALGATVVAKAILSEFDGKRLSYTVTASDKDNTVASGSIHRAIVDIERFMSRLQRLS